MSQYLICSYVRLFGSFPDDLLGALLQSAAWRNTPRSLTPPPTWGEKTKSCLPYSYLQCLSASTPLQPEYCGTNETGPPKFSKSPSRRHRKKYRNSKNGSLSGVIVAVFRSGTITRYKLDLPRMCSDISTYSALELYHRIRVTLDCCSLSCVSPHHTVTKSYTCFH